MEVGHTTRLSHVTHSAGKRNPYANDFFTMEVLHDNRKYFTITAGARLVNGEMPHVHPRNVPNLETEQACRRGGGWANPEEQVRRPANTGARREKT